MRLPAIPMLLATVAASAAALSPLPASAESYFFRTKPAVSSPAKPFSFPAATDLAPGTLAESAVVRVQGYAGTTASVSGNEAAFQVCANASCSDQVAWSTSPRAGLPGDFYARVRAKVGAFGSTTEAKLTVGSATAAFSAKATSGPPAGDFGLTDRSLLAAIKAALPQGGTWVRCSVGAVPGDEPCVGAKGTVVAYTGTSNGYEFGGFYDGDFASRAPGWGTQPGFYFTNVPQRSAYVMSWNGAAGPGEIQVSGSISFVQLQYVQTNDPYTSLSNGSWNPGYTLSGGANGRTVTGTVQWYKLK